MTASFARPAPLREALVASLMVEPPDLIQLHGYLREATVNAGYAAADVDNCQHHTYGPDDQLLADAEAACIKAARAIAAWRCKS